MINIKKIIMKSISESMVREFNKYIGLDLQLLQKKVISHMDEILFRKD